MISAGRKAADGFRETEQPGKALVCFFKRGDLPELLFDAAGCLTNSEWTGWLGGSAADRDGTNKLRQGKFLTSGSRMLGLTLDKSTVFVPETQTTAMIANTVSALQVGDTLGLTVTPPQVAIKQIQCVKSGFYYCWGFIDTSEHSLTLMFPFLFCEVLIKSKVTKSV